MKYRIKASPSNKTGSLPDHYDIIEEGAQDHEAIVTVWGSPTLADFILHQMENLLKQAAADDLL